MDDIKELVESNISIFKDLYDSENKMKFLNVLYDSTDTPKKTAMLFINVVKKLSVHEELLNVPITNMTMNQILSILKAMNSASIITLKTYLAIIRKYIEFIDGQNDQIDKIGMKEMEECIDKKLLEKKLVTEKEYLEILSLRENDNTINYQDLAMIVLLWRGIRGSGYDEIAEFKKADFNYSEGTLIYNGLTIKLLPIESEVLRKCIEETTYRHYGTLNREERVVELVKQSDNLFKETDHFNAENKLSYDSIKGRLSYFLKTRLKDISALDIYSSGVIYNVLKANDFKEMRVVDLDTKIKQAYQKISYNRLKTVQDEMLAKIRKEQIGSQ